VRLKAVPQQEEKVEERRFSAALRRTTIWGFSPKATLVSQTARKWPLQFTERNITVPSVT
jgi:hypothetical protein